MSTIAEYCEQFGYDQKWFTDRMNQLACFCACHHYPGVYPTTAFKPCCVCGHVHSEGFMRGSIRDGWLPNTLKNQESTKWRMVMDLKAKRADKPHLEADRPEIGQKVRVRAVAHPTDGRIRKWESYPCDPFEGVFVGVRFKRNGYTTQDTDFEATIHEAPYFVCQKTVEVWLVAYSKFHDPKCVLPEDCEVLPDEPDQGKSYLVIEKGF